MTDDMATETPVSSAPEEDAPTVPTAEELNPRLGVSSSMLGVSIGSAILAMTCGLAAISSFSEVYSIDAVLAVTTAVAVGGGAAALALAIVMATWGRSHFIDMIFPIGFVAMLVLVLGVGAGATHFDDDRDLFRFFDSGGAVVLALLGGLFVVVSLVAAAAIPSKAGRGRRRPVAVTVGLVVIVGAGVVVPVAGAYADHPWKPQVFADPTGGSYPTHLGRPSFHVLVPGDSYITRTDTGFVVAAGSVATAYDGATGTKLWSIDFTDFTPGGESGPTLNVTRVRLDRVDAVAITREGVGVQVDSSTGRVIRHVSLEKDRATKERVHYLAEGRQATVVGRMVTVESDNGTVIDRFELPEMYNVDGDGPAGILVLESDQLEDGDTFMFRDVVAHRFGTFETAKLGLGHSRVGTSSESVIGLGENFLMADFKDLVLVNRSGAVVQRRGTPCSGGEIIGGIFKQRGAILVQCLGSDSMNDSREIVGLTE
ncbi:hypothetical protein [Gordonia phthalatica]|uniref:Uncharacterized protein n=1 Tax=Gordonia phthalatica TaxID=1136941 RepID=A0A0N9NAC0_9ACTN|nr:hypothetical protein [Gordonia phthalatica]ALG84310.1 hypothetical protein ACH46_07095 [Gordonia phthalatica]